MNSQNKIHKVPLQLLIIFLLLSLGVGIAGYLYYKNQLINFKKDKQENISAIADLKVNQIVEWRRERIGDASIVQDNPLIAPSIQQYLNNPDAPKIKEDIIALMTSMKNKYGYESVLLLDSQGDLKQSVSIGNEVIGNTAKLLISEAIHTQKVFLSDIYYSETALRTRISLVIPILMHQGQDTQVVAVFLLRIDPYKFLYPLIQSWPTPSTTAESVLLRREGNDIVYLNDLRHRKVTALTLRLPITSTNLLSEVEVGGKEGVIEDIDYRGTMVLAASRRVPNSTWYLVAKIDKAEIYEPIRVRAWFTAFFSVILVLLAGISVIFFWRQQQATFYRSQYESEMERRALLQHYEYLTKYANDIILLFERNGKIVEVNERAIDCYGYTREELLHLNVTDLRSPETREFFALQSSQVAMQNANGLVYVTTHQRKNGTTFPAETSSRIIDIDGKTFFQCIIRDISERKKAIEQIKILNESLEHRVAERTAQLEAANQKLEKERNFISAVFNTAGALIIVLDKGGKILQFNLACEKKSGYSSNEIIGKYIWEILLLEEEVAKVNTIFTELQVGQSPIQIENHWKTKDGSILLIDWSGNLILDNEGNNEYIVGTGVDITEKRKAEEKIKNLNLALERRATELIAVNKELETFSYSVSHDLRAPLRSIDGFSKALQEDYNDKLDTLGKDYLNRICAASQRMGQLIDDLLNLSRVTRWEMKLEQVDLSNLAQIISAEIKAAQPKRQVEFQITPGLSIQGDARLFRVIMENLFGNAWKFTGRIAKAKIEFGVIYCEDKPVYFVRDNGAGFDLTYADKLFGAFQRLHTLAEFPGTGIGLATVQRIINRHGGKIWAESILNNGATFYFTI